MKVGEGLDREAAAMVAAAYGGTKQRESDFFLKEERE